MAPAAAPAYLYATEADLQALLSVDGEVGRVDDEGIGVVDTIGLGYVNQAINWATSKVNQYCLSRYNAADLANSWVVNNWCVILAAQWLSSRRGNPVPGSFADLYKEALEDLERVRTGEVQLPEIGLRNAAWPAWSNCRVDVLYTLRKVRVERPISEPSSTPYVQNRDVIADLTVEPN